VSTRVKSREREYTAPRLYEIAFDMNRKGEVDFLVHCFKRFARRPVRRVLDIACGTGPHLVRLAERGYQAAGLDLSARNIAYLGERLADKGLTGDLVVGDMTDFRLKRPVDAAICMQDSQGHLLETEALLAHLRAVRRNVRRGGVFVFDRLVPNGWNPGARWTWTRRRWGITVRTSFQTLLDYDVARQVCWEVMRFDITEKGRTRSVVQKHPTRIVFPQELRALVEMAGGWELCGWFSNFSLTRTLEKSAAALVMIVVLRAR